MLAVLMDQGEREFSRSISTPNVEQARALAKQLGYTVLAAGADPEWTELVFRFGPARPKLKLGALGGLSARFTSRRRRALQNPTRPA